MFIKSFNTVSGTQFRYSRNDILFSPISLWPKSILVGVDNP